MKNLHPRYRKKRSVVFMVLTVSGLHEKPIEQLLGFPATDREVMERCNPRFKRITPHSTHTYPQPASQPGFQMGTLKQKNLIKNDQI